MVLLVQYLLYFHNVVDDKQAVKIDVMSVALKLSTMGLNFDVTKTEIYVKDSVTTHCNFRNLMPNNGIIYYKLI